MPSTTTEQEFLIAQGQVAHIQKEIKKRLKQGQYEEAAEDLQNALQYQAFQDAILDEYGPHNLDGKKLEGTVSLLPQLSNGPVITTNFDQVLEKAFEEANAKFKPILLGATAGQTAQLATFQNKRCLLKLHGDVEDASGRVLTLTQYQNSYGSGDAPQIDFTRPLPSLLRDLLTQSPILFLGCSLNHDRVIKLVKQVAEEKKFAHHYAIVEHPGSENAFLKLQVYFSEHHIRPIWFPKRKYQCIESIVKSVLEQSSEIGEKLAPVRQQQSAPTTKHLGQLEGLKSLRAGEALEALIEQNPDIASFTLVAYYEDKPRLPERSKIRIFDDAPLYLAEASIHNDEQDEKFKITITNAGWESPFGTFSEFAPILENAVGTLRQGFALAVSSRVKLKTGNFAHIPMMDYTCVPTSKNVDAARSGLKGIKQNRGILLNSGKSFHYYGFNLLSEEQWFEFLGHSLLLTDLVDARYIGHSMIRGDCRLRLSPARLNPFIPTVVEVIDEPSTFS